MCRFGNISGCRTSVPIPFQLIPGGKLMEVLPILMAVILVAIVGVAALWMLL